MNREEVTEENTRLKTKRLMERRSRPLKSNFVQPVLFCTVCGGKAEKCDHCDAVLCEGHLNQHRGKLGESE